MPMPLSSARSAAGARRPVGVGGWLRGLFFRREALRHRRALRDLDDAILRDIGLSRDEALREAERGFWDWEPVRRE